jgi:TetR/AcrR family transcriptional regulator, transcriptional repressor for nem operon
MPRQKTYDKQETTSRAMERFWAHGFYATSIDDLVTTTGVNRHGLYAEYKDKRGVFIAAMRLYFESVVTPAFAQVEAKGACLAEVRSYFMTQIDMAERYGLPGPGCMVANTMGESGPHDVEFAQLIAEHLTRLTAGFKNALINEYQNERKKHNLKSKVDIDRLAFQLTVSSQGLWSVSRTTVRADLLRQYVDDLLQPIKEKFKS